MSPILGIHLTDLGRGCHVGTSSDGRYALDVIDHGEGSYSVTLRELRAWAHPGSDAPLVYLSRLAWDDLEPAIRRVLARGIDVRRGALALGVSPTLALSPEQVRDLLAEGREVRAELDRRLEAMHRIDPDDARRKAR